jgi:hypothetical protein
MTRVSPTDGASKWARNLGQATQDIAAGIARVTQAPGQKAAQASGKWLNKVTQAEAKFKANVGRVPLADWQKAATDGVSRVAAGANAKKGKMEAFATDFYAHLDRGAAAINAMPTNTLEDGVAKASAQIRHNAAFKRSGT